MKLNLALLVPLSALTAAFAGCGGPDASEPSPDDSRPIEVPATYTFESRFEPGVSSVAYDGQTRRHLLIALLARYIGSLDDRTFASPEPGDVVDALMYFVDFASAGASGDDPIGFDPGDLDPLQTTWAHLGGPNDLREKLPEVDVGFAGGVIGYGDGSLPPGDALTDMFTAIERLVIDRFQGDLPLDPIGTAIPVPYVSAQGVDYQQLVQKFVLGAVAFSQAADDYLDDDIPGKGLLADNIEAVDGRPYTQLEHFWDEGFGYFGAARDFGAYTDDEIAGAGGRPDWQMAHDTNGDGLIDLASEMNFGHATNAAKRDRGSATSAPTDYTATAFGAFLEGRTLIVNANGALTAAELDALRAHRDAALGAWERAIAATLVHYANDTLRDMAAFGTSTYDFLAHAKHWSELKGFALSLQFDVNHSPLDPNQLVELHRRIGDAPVLPTADAATIETYRADLGRVKAILQDAYGFDDANLGDMNGEGGW